MALKLIWLYACFIAGSSVVIASKPPIVLIPGDGGSQLWARLDKSSSPRWYCYKKSDWFVLWLSLSQLAPLGIDCFVDNIMLTYDRKTHRTSNTPGVETKVVDFGNTSGIEYLSSSKLGASDYYGSMVETAVTKWGYVRGKSILGAPFDFRKAPNELGQFYSDLTRLIERAYSSNGNQKVVLVAHSLGNNILLYFLNQKSKQWKKKFIDKYISLGAPWGGSMQLVHLMASGYNMQLPSVLVPPLKLRAEQRSAPSAAFMLPNHLAWNETEVLVQTDRRKYTVKDYREFFEDINYENGYLMHQDTKDFLKGFVAPDVQTHCFYGSGIPTSSKLTYGNGEFPDAQPSVSTEDGDGTVPVKSAHACSRWIGHQEEPVTLKAFDKVEHVRLLQNADVIEAVRKLVGA